MDLYPFFRRPGCFLVLLATALLSSGAGGPALARTPDTGGVPSAMIQPAAAPPEITSNPPPLWINVGEALSYSVETGNEGAENTEDNIDNTDEEDGKPPLLKTDTIPEWLAFRDDGDGTGLLFGTPERADTGEHDITVYAIDEEGNGDRQSFTITVAPRAFLRLDIPQCKAICFALC